MRVKAIATLESAPAWAATFVQGLPARKAITIKHAPSGNPSVSPSQRYAKEDSAILAARHALYQEAKE